MISSSPELLSVARRWFAAIAERRGGPINSLLSDDERLRFVGTAQGELWSGRVVREGTDRFFLQVPRMHSQVETFGEAFACGEVGWGCFVHLCVFENRPEAPVEFRTTLVFARENGSWKIIHRHGSVPVPNPESIGIDQSGIAALMEAAEIEFEMSGREGLATVMFTDVVSSSALAATLGDRAWSERISAHFAMVQSTIEEREGQFVKSLGDGTMTVFPSARRAMEAAQDIQRTLAAETGEPRLSVRIGLHTGNVVQTRDDFFGTVVNTAARIAEGAGGGAIHLSETTKAMVGEDDDFGFEHLGAFDLRGQSLPQPVYALNWNT